MGTSSSHFATDRTEIIQCTNVEWTDLAKKPVTPARGTNRPQVIIDHDDWPSSDQRTTENSSQEPSSEIHTASDEDSTEQISSANTGSNLRHEM